MQLEVGEIPPVLIPIDGKPIIDYIVNCYSKYSNEKDFFVIAKQERKLIEEYLEKGLIKGRINLIALDEIGDLGRSILGGLKKINLSEYDDLIINFGDTLIEDNFPLEKDFVVYDDRCEAFRWTTFSIEKGKIKNIIDKRQNESYKVNHIFAGFFFIKNIPLFFDCLRDSKKVENLDRFYSALQEYLKHVEYELRKTDKWYDVGHIDNYYQTKKEFVNTRFFNSIQIDENKGILVKRTQDTKKLLNEINWYLKLPKELQCYAPRVFDYSMNDEVFIELEYYGYSCLGDVYMFGNYELGVWNRIFRSVFSVIDEMNKFKLRVPLEKINESLEKMYINKTIDRLRELTKDKYFSTLFKEEIVINSKQYCSLRYYTEKVKDMSKKLLLNNVDHLNIIHGDLCLANILFDPKSGVIKLIDPRGEFGDFVIYGDPRYDLAKLSHSFIGKYELIINDLFKLSYKENRIEYNLFISEKNKRISNLFEEIMNSRYPSIKDQIKFIESLLFLSMLPIHKDYKKRQLVMLCRGIEKIDEIIGKYG